jgi:uncharacterized repeat protein (TIGR01451 family)
MGQIRRIGWRRRVMGTALLAVAPSLLLAGLLASAATAAVAAPDLAVTKSSDASGSLGVGDRFSYTITVNNVGTAAAHDVVVSDGLPRGLAVLTLLPSFPGGNCAVASSQVPPAPPSVSVYCTRSSLDAAASVSVSFEVKVTGDVRCGAMKNTATASADDEPAADAGNNDGSVVDTVVCTPSIALDTTGPGYAHAGERVAFSMKVHNDGQTTLGSVELSSPDCSPALVSDGNGDATLGSGETWTYRCTSDVTASTADPLTAEATVTAWSNAEQQVSAHDAASVRILDPALTIDVTADPVSGTAGETITYSYVVTNTGDAVVSAISVDDNKLGHIGDIDQLQPGHEATLTVDRVLSNDAVWVTTEATASGTDAAGSSVSATDDVSITIVAGHNRPTGGDVTAFTGLDASGAGFATTALAVIGLALLLAARRRA